MGVIRNVFVRTNLKPCPYLQQLESGQGSTLILWSIDTVTKYNDCKVKHNVIVKALE